MLPELPNTISIPVVTVMVSLLDAAVLGEAHGKLDVNWQLMISPVLSVLSEYLLEFVPTLMLFFFHWYSGEVPPLTGEAVNVTRVPDVTVVPGLAAIATATATFG